MLFIYTIHPENTGDLNSSDREQQALHNEAIVSFENLFLRKMEDVNGNELEKEVRNLNDPANSPVSLVAPIFVYQFN